jgi:hypothetical protein
MLGEHDTRIWRVVIHYVDQAREACDWSGVRRVAVDEVSRKKGHVYATNFLDLDTGKLLFMAPGKDASTSRPSPESWRGAGAAVPAQIEELAMDMSKAFRKGAAEALPRGEDLLRPLPCDDACRRGPRRGAQGGGPARGRPGERGNVVAAGQRSRAALGERRRAAAAALPRLRGDRPGHGLARVPPGHLELRHPGTGRGASGLLVFVGLALPPGTLQEAGAHHPANTGRASSTTTATGPPARPSSRSTQSSNSPARGRGASATSTTSKPSPTGSPEASKPASNLPDPLPSAF